MMEVGLNEHCAACILNHLWDRYAVPQVECPAVTPEVVLKASGHVERFTDFMVTG